MLADSNLFVALRRQLAGEPLQVGDVIGAVGNAWVVQLPGGVNVSARGQATTGQRVFVQGGVIQGPAPALPIVLIEV